MAFDGGYLAIEETDVGPVASVSKDGRRWITGPIAVPIVGCPPAELGVGAANGHEILLAGVVKVPDPTGCDGSERADVTWSSSDGRTWHQSASLCLANVEHDCDFVPQSVLAIPGGWEGFANVDPDRASLWRSSDGVRWEPVSMPADIAANAPGPEWAAPDGTVLMSFDDPANPNLAVLKPDGTWRMADYPAACPGVFATETLVVGPSFGSPDVWALSDGTDACISTDLSNWQRAKMPTKRGACPVESLASTRYGILATSTPNDPGCRGSFQWLSLDGTHWALLRSALDASDVVDGPAGVIGIRREWPDYSVWRLDP